ncbi:MAG: hypothetical protein KatS3mg114_0025 [Planctomycetaceae bacterium]|nr:MAG: hypothetical protein KatS3mg114_0025 [Planctomycetaceae bacterium]
MTNRDGVVQATRSILVIDGPRETDTVLRAVLEPQGAHVCRTRRWALSSELLAHLDPAVVVIDVDDAAASTPLPTLDKPQILIGSRKVDVPERGCCFLEKPFEYPELIAVINELLTQDTHSPPPPSSESA